ncbi:MAG: hypothetical protein WD851_19020 [Pirellulales bacterium]
MISGTDAPVAKTDGAGGPSDAHGFRQPGEQLAPELATTVRISIAPYQQRENLRDTSIGGICVIMTFVP